MAIRNKISSIIFLAGFSTTLIFSASVFAFNPNNPDIQNEKATLDKIKAQSIQFLNNHNSNYNLSEASQSDNDLAIRIQNVTYYFTPDNTLSDDDKTSLRNLINTGASSLVETNENNAMFSVINQEDPAQNKYYRYDTNKLPDSGFNYSKGSANNYNFKLESKDTNGNPTVKYYKFNILPERLARHNNVTITAGTSTDENKIAYNLPNDEEKYLKYTANPDDYNSIYSTRQNSISAGAEKRLFTGINHETTGNLYGGGLYINANYADLNIDFLNNKLTSTSGLANGGALYNNAKTIDTITGDFISNSVTGKTSAIAGAMHNYDGKIGKITGDFIANSVAGKTDAYGGAIGSLGANAYIDSILGNFIFNSATSKTTKARAGALFNDSGTIGNVVGDFISNSAISKNGAYGGAVWNNKNINNIVGDFIANSAYSESTDNNQSSKGGALNNNGTIDNITGDFILNSSVSSTKDAFAGAIFNDKGTIGNITGDFISNFTTGKTAAQGGGIWNNKIINNIKGNFIQNSANAGTSYACGGAILNSGANAYIDSILGNFSFNSATSETKNANGGAIYNDGGTIGNITGDFISNSTTGKTTASGGAIWNNKIINSIKGNFDSNSSNGVTTANGGAITNSTANAQIDSIVGNLSFNSATSETKDANGGAIYNSGNIGSINGNITNNSISAATTAYGGAIYNTGVNSHIDSIIGELSFNSAISETKDANGGAVNNSGTIGALIGNFLQNSATAKRNAYGGALQNSGTITALSGNFTSNFADGDSYASGGAIRNTKIINNIEGDFYSNSALSLASAYGGGITNTDATAVIDSILGSFSFNTAISETKIAYGGALYNYSGQITNVEGNFTSNSANAYTIANGGAVYNEAGSAKIESITGNFSNNSATSETKDANGGAIWNNRTISNIIGNFIQNKANGHTTAYGGAIRNDTANAAIGTITGDFTLNSATAETSNAKGGAIYNAGTLTFIDGNFTQNSAAGGTFAEGGAIWNSKIINDIKGDFIGNTINGKTTYAYGGAIYNYSANAIIDSITGDFSQNSAIANTYVQGGTIYNNGGTITFLKGDFSENSAQAGSYVDGGVIKNNKILSNIEGNFIKNSAIAGTSVAGGVIRNYGTGAIIDSIKGDFIQNSTQAGTYIQGGSIYNSGTIGSIKGDFKDNVINSETYVLGAGVYDYNSTIENLTGNFTGNVINAGTYVLGAGVYNYYNSTIENLTGNFTGNVINAGTYGVGVGVSNHDNATIGSLTGNFTNNVINAGTFGYGAGVFNYYNSTIENLTGNFTNNVINAGTYGIGGGIYSSGTIENLAGNFTGNIINARTYGSGGGMYGLADNLTGNFTGNIINTGTYGRGGGMYGAATNLTGNFTENTINAGTYGYGGGLFSLSTIENLTGDFKDNSINAEYYAQGGGIFNIYRMLSFKGDVINNSAASTKEETQGGGIYNYAENAYNRFLESYTSIDGARRAKNIEEANIIASEQQEARRQALLADVGMTEEEYNNQLAAARQTAIDNINWEGYDSIEDWVQNETQYNSLDEYVLKGLNKFRNINEYLNYYGYYSSVQERMEYLGYATLDEMINALYKDRISIIEKIKGNIIGNSVKSKNNIAQGGGIFNRGKAAIYDSDITFNSAKGKKAQGGAIFNGGEFAKLYLIADGKDLTFIENKTTENGKTQSNAIHNEANIYLNTNSNVADRAINNGNIDARIVIHDKITGDYRKSPLIEINKLIDDVLYTTVENEQTINHNIVLNQTTGTVEFHNDVRGNNINLYSGNTIVVADNNNIKLGSGAETLTFKNNNAKLNINALNNNTVTANMKIAQEDGVEASVDINKADILITKTKLNKNNQGKYTGTVKNSRYELNNKENSGTVVFNNDVNVKNVNMYNGNLTLAHDITSQNINLYGGTISMLDGINFNSNQNFNVYGGGLNLQNGKTGNTNLGNLILHNELGLRTDIDFTNHNSDTITVNSLVNDNNHNINLKNIKVVNPIIAKSFKTSLIGNMQDEALRNKLAASVKYSGGDIIYSPIYKYGVSYDNETGELSFERTGGPQNTHPTYSEVNPAVMSSTVARNTIAYSTQANAHYEGFRSLNEMMYNTRAERFAMKNKNKYALADTKDEKIDSLLRSGVQIDDEEKTGWFKAGSNIETIKLKGGPKTDNVLYYSFIGYDSELREISKFKLLKGWDFMHGAYIGYNGGYQKFDGVSSVSNGVNLGLTLNMFKGNLFSGTTIGNGLMFSESSNMFGNEDFQTISSGIANKTGYNFEFKDGKYIIQPSLFISYSMFNTLDYTNAEGVKIKSDVLHLFTFEPGIKFIANLDNGWQPYIGVSFVDNIDMGGEVKANNVVLPEVSVKPYVKYGLGIRKKWKDSFSGYAQAYVTNGGRTGVGLQAGFSWLFDIRNPFTNKIKEEL